jgi:hypothetical protein
MNEEKNDEKFHEHLLQEVLYRGKLLCVEMFKKFLPRVKNTQIPHEKRKLF